MIGLWLLVACAPEDTAGWTAPAGWASEPVPSPEVLATGLDIPAGIAADGDGWVVAEYGGGRVLRVSDAGVEELATGLSGPWGIAMDGARVLVSERDGGRIVALEDGESTVMADGLLVPGRVAAASRTVVWVDEGTGADGALWAADDSGAVVSLATGLASPLGLAVEEGTAFVCERGANRVVSVVLTGEPPEVYAEVGQAPQDVTVVDGIVWFSAYTYS